MIGGYVSPELEIHHHFIPREIQSSVIRNLQTSMGTLLWKSGSMCGDDNKAL
ncbi:MAG: hypothetical protein ACLVIY_09745 [Anaerobutyricum soehngenii]